MEPIEIKQFCERLQTRDYSNHTVENYGLYLRLFFTDVDQQSRAGLAATTINRRLNAIKHFFLKNEVPSQFPWSDARNRHGQSSKQKLHGSISLDSTSESHQEKLSNFPLCSRRLDFFCYRD